MNNKKKSGDGDHSKSPHFILKMVMCLLSLLASLILLIILLVILGKSGQTNDVWHDKNSYLKHFKVCSSPLKIKTCKGRFQTPQNTTLGIQI